MTQGTQPSTVGMAPCWLHIEDVVDHEEAGYMAAGVRRVRNESRTGL